MLELKNICFSYENVEILKDISFKIEKNQIVSLLGANGSGKSTLIKIILGFLNYHGEVLIDGIRQSSLNQKELATKIAYVAQQSFIPFDYTAFEVVLMGRYHHTNFWSRYSKDDKFIVQEALESVGVSKFKDRFYKSLSGGEKQLVLLARAIAQKSDIIVMDEPVTGLDLANQIKLLDNIKALSQNHTILQTTHYPEHALKISDSVVWLDDRRIFRQGMARDVITTQNIKQIYSVKSEILRASNNKEYLITL